MEIVNGFYLCADGKEHHLLVYSPAGGGGYHVYVDHFFYGQLVPSPGRWLAEIQGYALNSDDIGALLDLVEELSPISSHYNDT